VTFQSITPISTYTMLQEAAQVRATLTTTRLTVGYWQKIRS